MASRQVRAARSAWCARSGSPASIRPSAMLRRRIGSKLPASPIISSRLSSPSFVFAETSTKIVSPPQSSGVSPWEASSLRTRSGCASGPCRGEEWRCGALFLGSQRDRYHWYLSLIMKAEAVMALGVRR